MVTTQIQQRTSRARSQEVLDSDHVCVGAASYEQAQELVQLRLPMDWLVGLWRVER